MDPSLIINTIIYTHFFWFMPELLRWPKKFWTPPPFPIRKGVCGNYMCPFIFFSKNESVRIYICREENGMDVPLILHVPLYSLTQFKKSHPPFSQYFSPLAFNNINQSVLQSSLWNIYTQDPHLYTLLGTHLQVYINVLGDLNLFNKKIFIFIPIWLGWR